MSGWPHPLCPRPVGTRPPGHRGCPTPLIRNKQLEAVKQYASVLFPAPEFIGLLIALNVPKGGFLLLSELMSRRGAAYTAATGLPFPRLIPSRDRFMHTGNELVNPARSSRVPRGSPNKRTLLAVAILGPRPLQPIAFTPCGHHRLEAAPHFPPPWAILPVLAAVGGGALGEHHSPESYPQQPEPSQIGAPQPTSCSPTPCSPTHYPMPQVPRLPTAQPFTPLLHTPQPNTP